MYLSDILSRYLCVRAAVFNAHTHTPVFCLFQRTACSSSDGTEDSDFSAEHTDSSESDGHAVKTTRLTRSSLRLSQSSQGTLPASYRAQEIHVRAPPTPSSQTCIRSANQTCTGVCVCVLIGAIRVFYSSACHIHTTQCDGH